jgi:hypothetical protein
LLHLFDFTRTNPQTKPIEQMNDFGIRWFRLGDIRK